MPTVRVKVCVAVDPKGRWSSAGWHVSKNPPSDGDVISSARDMVEEGERLYWLTADLELPAPNEATVVEANVEGCHSKT